MPNWTAAGTVPARFSCAWRPRHSSAPCVAFLGSRSVRVAMRGATVRQRGEPDAAEFRLSVPEAAAAEAPLVVVLGWYGAQLRHVAKYASLLAEAGYPSLCGVLPGTAVFSPVQLPRRRFAARLLDSIAAADPQGARPIVFFAFSNGGAFVLEQVDALLHDSPAPAHARLAARVSGIIFDSAPCFMHPTTGATALGTGLSPPLRALAAALFFCIMLLIYILSPRRPLQYWSHMERLRLAPRTLFLYSADDHLCDAGKLDQLVAARRTAHGAAAVQAVRWERSQHVAHLLKHYKEYTAALFGFLQECRAAT